MKFLRNNTFLKFVMSFVILVCFTIGIFGIFSYQSTKKIVLQRYSYQQQELLKHLSAGIQDRISVINEITLMGSMDSRVSKAYFYEQNDNKVENIQNYREIINYLKSLSSSIESLLNISVHYNFSDVVVSQDGKFSAEMFYNQIAKYEDMEPEDWKKLLEEYRNFSLIHSGSVNIGGHKERTFTFGRTLPYDNTSRVYASILVTVSEEFFNKMISPNMVKQNGNITIVENGKVVLTTVSDLSGEAEKQFLQYNGKNQINIDGKSYLVSTLTDDFNDWKYIFTVPMDEVIVSINNFKITILALMVIVLLLGGMLSLYFAKRLYMPISEIAHSIGNFNVSEDSNINDDFELIRNGLSNIFVEKDSLTDKLEMSNSLLRAKVILDIINGRTNVLKEKYNWSGLGISFPFECFQVIVIQEKNLYQSGIDDVIKDSVKLYHDEMKLYVVTKDGYYILLCNYNIEDEADAKIYEIANKLAHVAIGEVIGIGKAYHRIDDVVQSYIEALYALRYSGTSIGIASAENISYTEQTKKCYSIEEEQKLIWAVKTGDLQSTDNILQEFITLNEPVIYNALMMTAYKITVSYSLMQSGLDYNMMIFPTEDTEVIKSRIIQHFHTLVEHFSKGVNEKYNDIFLKIKEKVDINFTQEISLQQLGDEIGYSASYLSFVFKEVTKGNYLDYVNKLRTDYAKELLLKTELPLTEIAVKVGYNNTVTLNRVFKKIVGTTPGKYRENNI